VSAEIKLKAVTTTAIRDRKNSEPIVCLTAYTAPMAKMLDKHVDVLLVGDSLGMVVYGLPTTIGVTMDMMINHGAAVVRGADHACVVVDMPFGSYQESPEQAFRNAARLMMETGCAAVKLEGGSEMAPTIKYLVERGVPVMAHVGLTPQSFHAFGGFRAQGKTDNEADKIFADAQAVADAGAFSVVLEGTHEPVARRISQKINIPTIGIGASSECDGQILVVDDILGMFMEFKPKFVKRFAELAPQIDEAVAQYAKEVKERSFPAAEHCFGVKPKA